MNRIVKVVLTLTETGEWLILVTKEFATEHGGGEHTFSANGGYEIHHALRVTNGMVTTHPTILPESVDNPSNPE